MDEIDGSRIAKNGFRNEKDVASKFINWEKDIDAQIWLNIMGYVLEDIEYVFAKIIHGHKTDVQVQITIKLKNIIDAQNLQVKLVSNPKGFNQIDKRWVDTYAEMWKMPENVVTLLKYFTGELEPYKDDTKDPRRMFISEFTISEQEEIISFFEENKTLILLDIIKGRGKLSAEWILVALKLDDANEWTLKPINMAINHYSSGKVRISPRGSLNIGKVGMQRKGGDGGRKTAQMLQFKVNPVELFDL